jgi:hypothetical protein
VLPEGGNSCTPSDTTQSFPYSQTGSNDHVWGSHSAEANINVRCTCSSACASTCAASVISSSCSDSGFPADMCHKMATSTKESGDFKGNGHQTPSACAAGVGCVKKSCLFCLCGLSISVTVSGVTVTFAPSSAVDWDANHSGSAVCPVCELTPPPPPPPPGGGGGGGGGGTGGGGGGMSCNGTLYDFDCGNDGSWDFLEECVPAGQTAASIGCGLCFGSGLTEPGSALAAPQSNFVASCGSLAGGAGVGGNVRAVPSTIVASLGGARAGARK